MIKPYLSEAFHLIKRFNFDIFEFYFIRLCDIGNCIILQEFDFNN